MALSPKLGTITPPSILTQSPTPLPANDVFKDVPLVQDINIEASTFSSDDYPVDNRLLRGWIGGSRYTVTYFHRHSTGALQRDDIVDDATLRNVIHNPLHMISNFEITIDGDLNFDFIEEETESSVTGSALLYGGLEPTIGDAFLMDLHTGTVAYFAVTKVDPQSMHKDRMHRIEYEMKRHLSEELRSYLQSSVVKHSWFVKDLFLRSTSGFLIANDDYIKRERLQQLRKVISNYYFNKFFNDEMDTIMRPDGVYDPYIVEFVRKTMEVDGNDVWLRQLYPNFTATYPWTIWYKLFDSYNTIDNDMEYRYSIQTYRTQVYNPNITSLLNKDFILVNKENAIPEDTYILSSAFYNGAIVDMSEFERMVHDYIKERCITNIDLLINGFVNSYNKWEPMTQFYFIPIVLRLVKIAITDFISPPINPI